MPPWWDCCSPPSTIPFGLLASPTQVTLGLRQRLSSYCSCGKHRRGSLSSFVPSAVLGSRYFIQFNYYHSPYGTNVAFICQPWHGYKAQIKLSLFARKTPCPRTRPRNFFRPDRPVVGSADRSAIMRGKHSLMQN